MSGRLIILPKKSYTPWNPQNIERVMRDERIEREQNEREERKKKLNRVKLMKENKKKDDGYDDNIIETEIDEESKTAQLHQQHVNFFKDEEKEMLSTTILGPDGAKKKQVGIMPVFLTSKRRQMTSVPFYYRQRYPNRIGLEKDEKLKLNMDPMHIFAKQSRNDDYVKQSIQTIKKAEVTSGLTNEVEVYIGIEKGGGRKHRRRSNTDKNNSSDSDSLYDDSKDKKRSKQCKAKKRRRRKDKQGPKERKQDGGKANDADSSSCASSSGRHVRRRKRRRRKREDENQCERKNEKLSYCQHKRKRYEGGSKPIKSSTISLKMEHMKRQLRLREEKESKREEKLMAQNMQRRY